MSLADIAEGVRSVETQHTRDVAIVDAVNESLADRLEGFASDLPCSPTQADRLARQFGAGESIESCAETVGVTRTNAARTLHLLGFAGVITVDPVDREIIKQWINGEIDRITANRRTDLDKSRFALAVYVETHEPLTETRAAIEPTVSLSENIQTDRRRALDETMADSTDLQPLYGST